MKRLAKKSSKCPCCLKPVKHIVQDPISGEKVCEGCLV